MRGYLPALLVLAALAAVPAALAQTDPAILHQLALEAQTHVELQIQPSDPPEAWALLANGTTSVGMILNSTTNDEAEGHFLSAMQAFTRAFTLMDDNGSPEVSPNYSEMLQREARYFEQLLYLAGVYKMEVDRAQLDGLFAEARTMIESGDEGVPAALEQIKQAVLALRQQIAAVAAEEGRERAIAYAREYLAQLDRFLEVADTLNIPDDVIEQIQSLRDELAAATEPNRIASLIHQIIGIKEGLELDPVDRLRLLALQLEDGLMQYWKAGLLGDAGYAAASVSLEKCRFFLDIGELDEAAQILHDLQAMLALL